MNKLSRDARAQILGMMVEGVSIRAISRMTGASNHRAALGACGHGAGVGGLGGSQGRLTA